MRPFHDLADWAIAIFFSWFAFVVIVGWAVGLFFTPWAWLGLPVVVAFVLLLVQTWRR